MPKFAVLFSLKGEAIAAMMERPSDREAMVRRVIEAAGGKLEAYYWMFGQYDGLVIADLPSSGTAAAVSLATSSSGAFARIETHELIPAGDVNTLLERAKGLKGAYAPPGL